MIQLKREHYDTDKIYIYTHTNKKAEIKRQLNLYNDEVNEW